MKEEVPSPGIEATSVSNAAFDASLRGGTPPPPPRSSTSNMVCASSINSTRPLSAAEFRISRSAFRVEPAVSAINLAGVIMVMPDAMPQETRNSEKSCAAVVFPVPALPAKMQLRLNGFGVLPRRSSL